MSDSAATTLFTLADAISDELGKVSVDHHVARKWSAGAEHRSIQGIARFGSVRAFAAALERAGADASYSAGGGWEFRHVGGDDAD